MGRGGVVAAAVAGVVAVALPAWAYFVLSSNSSTATATARSLGTPAVGTASVVSGDVSFSVAAPSSGPAPTGYRVDRSAPSAASAVCSLPAAGGTCTDAAAVAGATNTYAVYALLGAWESPTAATVSAAVPALSFLVTPSTTTPTAGTAFTVTVTARSGTDTDTGYSGSRSLTWSGGQSIGAHTPAYPATATFTGGVATVSVTLPKAGAQTLTVSEGAYSGNATVTVGAATPRLTFSNCPATYARNSSFTTTVTRTGTDPYGNAVTAGEITVTLAPSSGNAKFTTASTSLAAGVLASGTLTFNTPSASGTTASLTATATGYGTATCSVTTT